MTCTAPEAAAVSPAHARVETTQHGDLSHAQHVQQCNVVNSKGLVGVQRLLIHSNA
jgi:hypothetical protein